MTIDTEQFVNVLTDATSSADSFNNVQQPESADSVKSSHPYLGLLLSVISAVLVGASFILQKKGILHSTKRNLRQSVSEFAYLKTWNWWMGMLCMAVGEILNFIAYTIAPAILVTPLGALRVIVSAVLSAMFLKEHLESLGKIGVLLSLLGSTMIVIHAPRHERVSNFIELISRFEDPVFITYCGILLLFALYLIFRLAPRYGRSNILVYVTICNIIGALTVLCGKGLGITLKDLLSSGDALRIILHPLFWVLIIANVVGIPTQIVYINKSLASFNTSAVTPIKYVCTNVLLIIGSMILFEEFYYLSPEDCIGLSCGFITIIVGVILLTYFKSENPGPKSSYGDYIENEQEMSLIND